MKAYHRIMSWVWWKLRSAWHNHKHPTIESYKVYRLGCCPSDGGNGDYDNWQCRLCDWLDRQDRYHQERL